MESCRQFIRNLVQHITASYNGNFGSLQDRAREDKHIFDTMLQNDVITREEYLYLTDTLYNFIKKEFEKAIKYNDFF